MAGRNTRGPMGAGAPATREGEGGYKTGGGFGTGSTPDSFVEFGPVPPGGTASGNLPMATPGPYDEYTKDQSRAPGYGPSVPAPVGGLNPPSLPPMPQDDPNYGRIAGAWSVLSGAPRPTQVAGNLPGPPPPRPNNLPGPPSPRPQPGPPAPKPSNIARKPGFDPDLARPAGGVSGFTDGMGGPERGSNPDGYSGGFEGAGYGSNSYGTNPNMSSRQGFDDNSTVGPTSYGNVPTSGNLANPGGPGGGNAGGYKIVCTAMNEDYGFGSFRNAVWLRQSKGLDPAYQRGYHAIFRPILAWSRRSGSVRSLVYRLLQDIARQRTIDIRLEERHGPIRPLIRGRVYRAVLEPLCFVVGKLARD